MTDFSLLQNDARNFLMLYSMMQPGTLAMGPGFRGKLEFIAMGWRNTLKVVGREGARRLLRVDPKCEGEGARVLAVFVFDAGRVWLIDVPELYGLRRI